MPAPRAHGSSVADPVAGRGGVSLFAPWRHRFALLLVGSTLALIFIGVQVWSQRSARAARAAAP